MKLILALLAACLCVVTTAQAETPNIVVILADDLGQGDLGCYNDESKVPTPHMDRVAAEGMRLGDVHSPSAVCTPTRYGLLAGRYSWRTRLKNGVLWGYSKLLFEPKRETIASMLKDKGYHTACIGKWHLGFQEYQPDAPESETDYSLSLDPGPRSVGFDFFYGIPASLDMQPYLWVKNESPVEAPTSTVEGSSHRRKMGGGFWRAGPAAPNFKHIDVLPTIANQAKDYIEERAEHSEQPFFLYLPLSAPHTPWLPTPEFEGRSQAGWYGDFTAMSDWVIGEVLHALDRKKLTDNTLLIITSDNGSHWPTSDIKEFDHKANLDWRGMKADIHEGGHRVPFLVRWPGKVEPGSSSEQTLCLTDIYATCAEVVEADLNNEAAVDSFSMLPILKGEDTAVRDSVVHHSAQGVFAIRQGDWKLIEGLGSGGFTNPKKVKPEPDGPQGQLYNLKDDPSEKNNLWLKHPDIVARLTAELDRIRDSGRSRTATE
ncbi:sulfatase family protein [Calycomorphotria hydatis]|uniref:Arylsulfatase n=1 Tax=Calycomorphotria hydatis TaxID=2528027 RepID=A0A517TCH3_9PLAN|nr:arylsulfatase [Calycomorphotria hydatis]QDT66063.1 Arylsulfatase [Calycomorphotria hydatis]